MLEHELGQIPAVAKDKARAAYGNSMEKAYERALERFRDNPETLQLAFDALAITPEARAIIRDKLSKLG